MILPFCKFYILGTTLTPASYPSSHRIFGESYISSSIFYIKIPCQYRLLVLYKVKAIFPFPVFNTKVTRLKDVIQSSSSPRSYVHHHHHNVLHHQDHQYDHDHDPNGRYDPSLAVRQLLETGLYNLLASLATGQTTIILLSVCHYHHSNIALSYYHYI